MPSMETARITVHRDAFPVDDTLTARVPRFLRITVGTASNRVLISSMLTTDLVGIPIDNLEELTRKIDSSVLGKLVWRVTSQCFRAFAIQKDYTRSKKCYLLIRKKST